ncbi:hypothetical protein [Micromonospora sp. 4G55]|uniref:hypothetical protein n=1 Tax=Micromonospora sp. 4G55 TaxID=2806102 RepID=UPI001A5E3B94|nr:hypothetical protein [Micromonospora sp. 4G55]MBM0257605.1 hypothetical protein [Micromonospora sp. 4G55]
MLYFAAVLLASDETLNPHLGPLVGEVVLLVLANLVVPDLLVVVRIGRDPLVKAIAVVELLVTRADAEAGKLSASTLRPPPPRTRRRQGFRRPPAW